MSSDTFEQRSMARNAFGDRQFGTDDRDDTDRDDTGRDADGEIFDRDDLSDRNGAGDATLDSETEEQRLVQTRDRHEFADADADAEDAVDRDLTDSAQGPSESSDSDAEMTEADLRGSELTAADLTGSEVTDAEFANGEANDADGADREATDEFTNGEAIDTDVTEAKVTDADDSDADGVVADTVIDADLVAPDPDDIEDGYDRESNASDADRRAFDGIAADDADNRVIDGAVVDRDVSADDVSVEDVVAADLTAGPAGTGGDMLPGALPVEDDVVVPGVSDLKARWQQAQMGFIDDPAGSAESAAAIAAEALDAHIGALRDRLAELGAWQSRDQAAGVQATGVQDTEVLRGAVHGYRAFVQQIVGE